jgi:hypothetical protein
MPDLNALHRDWTKVAQLRRANEIESGRPIAHVARDLGIGPEHERLSDVLKETEGQIFRDEEFAAHLQRVAATEDDQPA